MITPGMERPWEGSFFEKKRKTKARSTTSRGAIGQMEIQEGERTARGIEVGGSFGCFPSHTEKTKPIVLTGGITRRGLSRSYVLGGGG
jgi:hypothetical protein